MTTLEEKFQEFQSKISEFKKQRVKLVREHEGMWAEYHKVRTEYNELLELNEEEKAKELEPKLKELRLQVENIKGQVESMGNRSIENIKAAAQRHPDSKLHMLAEGFQNSGLVTMGVLEENLGILLNEELPKAKEKYLALVSKAGNMVRELFNAYWMLKEAEGVLPVEKRKSKSPQRAPEWTIFDMEEAIGKAYGKRPFLTH